MRNDKLYNQLVAKMHQVAVVPPQTVGPLTPIYKKLAVRLKFTPWRYTVVLAFLFTLCLYLILGQTLVKLASILQYGF
jgi:hypothetical protein